MYIVLNPIL